MALADQQLPEASVVAGRYVIESVLGRGGLATVYRARDESLRRQVALKVVDAGDADTSAIDRGRSEIELLASLSHPALVTLFDAGTFDTAVGPRSVLVMELVDGPDLGARLAQGPVAHDDVARLTLELAEALHVVHARGIVHRDIKPGNVLLARSVVPLKEFTAKLADFGIAYLVDATRLTATGTLIGTAAYLSPEQAKGLAPQPPSDIYSLGLVILEALTRERAFPGSLAESAVARLSRDPELPPTLSAEWRDLLGRMTARDPDARPTALDVAVAARTIAGGERAPLSDTPTVVLDEHAATRVMATDATERLAPAAAPTAPSAIRHRRWPIAAVIIVAAVVIGGFAVSALTRSPEPPATAPTPPAVEGELGIHLDELFEAVSP